jgi:hypothetical protein
MITEDKIVYLVTKEGFVLNPADAVDLDPQTIQQHPNKQEITLRTDRVALLILARATHLRYYSPPMHEIEPIQKIEIILPDELSDAFHTDFLAERNAILEQELTKHAQTARDHNDLVRRQELAALAKIQSPLATQQQAFNDDEIAARIKRLS